MGSQTWNIIPSCCPLLEVRHQINADTVLHRQGLVGRRFYVLSSIRRLEYWWLQQETGIKVDK